MRHGCVGTIGRFACGEHPEPFCPGGPTGPPFRIETPDAWPRVVLFFFLLPRPSTRRWSRQGSYPLTLPIVHAFLESQEIRHFYFAWVYEIGRIGVAFMVRHAHHEQNGDMTGVDSRLRGNDEWG